MKLGSFFLLALWGILVPVFSYSQATLAPSVQEHSWWDTSPSGFYNVTSFTAVTFTGQVFPGMKSIAGYRLNPHVAYGGGAGIGRYNEQSLYDTVTASLTVLPVFADARYTILDRKVSPVIAVQGGYQFLLNTPSTEFSTWTDQIFPGMEWTDYFANDTYDQGGFFFAVEAGVSAHVWKRIRLYGSLAYTWWSVSGTHNTWAYQHTGSNTTETYEGSDIIAYTHAFSVRIGFAF